MTTTTAIARTDTHDMIVAHRVPSRERTDAHADPGGTGR